MSLLKNAKGRQDGSGYARLFGNRKLGYLISRVQAAVISSGTELERIIRQQVYLIPNLDSFLDRERMPDGVQVAEKRQIKKSTKLSTSGAEPDFLVFRRRKQRQSCHVIELKDGDAFDTKKSAAEYESIHGFIRTNSPNIPYTVQAHFCCFNQNDKKTIVQGFKSKIDIREAMTGPEFCSLLEIDYDKIVSQRQQHCSNNVSFFLRELLNISSVREEITKLLNA
ncbi:MAG: hypothetical protein OXB93_01290 [Cytophagales bacterium]|nr:hypothetical protein [Cytophagales bacterium]